MGRAGGPSSGRIDPLGSSEYLAGVGGELSFRPTGENSLKPRAILQRHALMRGHLDEDVRESQAAGPGPVDESFPFQSLEMALEEGECLIR